MIFCGSRMKSGLTPLSFLNSLERLTSSQPLQLNPGRFSSKKLEQNYFSYKNAHFPNRLLNSSVRAGTTSNKSPTTPYLAKLKIGASLSLLIAMISLEVRIPA